MNALVLLRSFFFNSGLPVDLESDDRDTRVRVVVDAITPFYYAERLQLLRLSIPLLRAAQSGAGELHDVAEAVLRKVAPDPARFADTLLTEYAAKTHAPVPAGARDDPRAAAAWAKQNVMEQLVLLEVLFWTMWDSAPRSGPLVARIFETAYSTQLGSQQHNATLLLDEEAVQVLQDCAAMWIMVTIEVLELERAGEEGEIEISVTPKDKEVYWSSPAHLKQIHQTVISHGNSNFACTYVAWTCVLSRLSKVALAAKELPEAYRSFFDSLIPEGSGMHTKDAQQACTMMANIGLSGEAGLFRLMHTLLTTSPLFVPSVAWRNGSSITDPNNVAYRSALKGMSSWRRTFTLVNHDVHRSSHLHCGYGARRAHPRL